jgi:hypothetical protein
MLSDRDKMIIIITNHLCILTVSPSRVQRSTVWRWRRASVPT